MAHLPTPMTRRAARIRRERNQRIRWFLADAVGVLALFAIPVVGLYIAHGFGL